MIGDGKKDRNIEAEWTDICEESVVAIKRSLTSDPVVLAHPDWNYPFVLITDACDSGAGAILVQDIEGCRKTVAVWSHGFNARQLNWCTTEKEAFAVVGAIRTFRHYLVGPRFTVYSDHHCLTKIKKLKDTHGRIARWLIDLAAFDFDIKYVKGDENVVADALSRVDHSSLEPDQPNLLCFFGDNDKNETEASDSISFESILLSSQTTDPFISAVREYLSTKSLPNDPALASLVRQYANRCEVKDDRLKISMKKRLALVIPRSLVDTVLFSAHDDKMFGGHCGFDRTFYRLKKYFWPGMTKEIKDYVASCTVCARFNIPNKKPYGRMKPITMDPSSQPMDFVSVDVTGPLEVSAAGYKYIIVFVDYATRWAFAFPTKHHIATFQNKTHNQKSKFFLAPFTSPTVNEFIT